MTPSELKARIAATGKEPHFFDRKTMKFFGDTMKNFGVCRTLIWSEFDRDGNYHPDGVKRDVWELYRKRPVKHGLSSPHFFDAETFAIVHQKKKEF